MAQDKGAEAPEISCGEKCGDLCGKIGQLCKVAGAVACGGLGTRVVKVGGGTAKTFKKVAPCMGDTIKPFFEMHGGKKFLFHDDGNYTFKEVFAIYQAVGNEIRGGLGVNIGESVGVCMKNMPEFMLAFLAITSVGCRVVTLNSMWGTKELEYAVKDSDCKVIFCDEQRLNNMLPFAGDVGCKFVLCGSKGQQEVADKAGATLFEKVVEDGKQKPAASTKEVKEEDDAMIMYTSGSTGNPKGVVHSQCGLGTAMIVQELAALTASDTVDGKGMLAVPLFHITAIVNVFLYSIVAGQQLHIIKKWDAGKAIEIIAQHKLTRFIGVPTMVGDMFEHATFTPEKFASVKNLAGGGAAVPPALQMKMRRFAKGAGQQGYGLTETCGGVIVNKGLDAAKHPTSTGKPIPIIVEAVTKDPATGKTIPGGGRGELCVRCATMMSRYHNMPEATAKAMDSEGFFHTGDVAKIEGGFVYILDRLKDLIIRGGENIDCSEVESKAYASPNVREVSVFGVPDKRLGEEVGMAVWLKEPMTTEELNTFIKGTGIAAFKVPKPQNIFIHDEELPKGPTGKIDKKGMREKYADIVKAREEAA